MMTKRNNTAVPPPVVFDVLRQTRAAFGWIIGMIRGGINAILSPILASMIRLSLAHPMLTHGSIDFALAKRLLPGRVVPSHLPLRAARQVMYCWPLINGSRLAPNEIKAAFDKQKNEV
jgi:hypothetical protein